MTERPVESVLIEIPKGSRNKYEYDKEKKVIKYDRMLFSSMVYPSDYGFFPDTLALDGDPLDAMVLTWEPTFPGCIIEVHLVALFDMEDDKGRDQKILCVPKNDPMWNYIETVEQVPPHLFKEITNFFQTYKNLEEKRVKVIGWKDLETAVAVLQEAKDRYLEQKK
ncbi:MAG: inorganic diphosphatase [Methanosarcina vacuolata]|jgi:inorganic pyrophosphatase|uniref:Inorganic pyrophosphatase n=1 Tax=Methanosarcina vacuolata Z-761 TaxID=1434123 RepID=A0A0E3LHV8_9EURY|nr:MULTISPECIES: inorganic diphosphatase [Methanosarcina]AKB44946.1 Inorganic pyrophosphatase [Methanosarcina vacuolata Z-761]AKB48457.1 Inorganic pyrophosphatase [Methanosarcina sp. Kolksee]MDY0129506.1 inorganic diphosphatase [Methanosarcina vacuolata]